MTDASPSRTNTNTLVLNISREALSEQHSETIASSARSIPTEDEDEDSTHSDDEEDQNEEVVRPDLSATIVVGRPTLAPSYVLPVDAMTIEELRKFVLTPASQSTRFLCQITRTRQKAHQKYYPHYDLYIEDHSDPTEIQRQLFLWARKRKRSHTSCYEIGATVLHPDGKGTKEEILGLVRSNFVGTKFTIYSHGRNPFKEDNPDALSESLMREELAVVVYDPNMLGFKGPRKMTILMPSMTREGERIVWRPTTEADTLSGRYKAGNTSDMLVLHNKSPQWNEDTQAFVLNFGGRVSLASVKNFQLVHDQDLDYIILQFGRTGADTFTMDFQYPLCPLQALGMVLTSFDAKIACE